MMKIFLIKFSNSQFAHNSQTIYLEDLEQPQIAFSSLATLFFSVKEQFNKKSSLKTLEILRTARLKNLDFTVS